MKAQGSLDYLSQKNKQQARSLAQHDEQLRAALIEACEAAGVPDGITSEIVENGIYRFTISADGEVKPLSAFADLESFIDDQTKTLSDRRKTPKQTADERIMKKAELFDLLTHYAKVGDINAYRKTRKEYALL